jgi:uncharacterized membrane protein YdbT with pleckstrin-like domain
MSANQEVESGKSFPGQHEGEDVELVFHQHPLVMRKPLIYGLLAILVGSLIQLASVSGPFLSMPQAYGIATKIFIGLAVLTFAGWFYEWIGWYYTVYIITNMRIIEIKQKGFFNRKVSDVPLDRVQSINYHIKGFQAVLFQYGDITAQTYIGDILMKTIYKPVAIHEKLLKIVNAYGGGATSHPNDAPPPMEMAKHH